jgi:hypothetical protein
VGSIALENEMAESVIFTIAESEIPWAVAITHPVRGASVPAVKSAVAPLEDRLPRLPLSVDQTTDMLTGLPSASCSVAVNVCLSP